MRPTPMNPDLADGIAATKVAAVVEARGTTVSAFVSRKDLPVSSEAVKIL